MRTTLHLDDELYQNAMKATGIAEKTKLIHMGFEALIRDSALRELAHLHGAIRKAKAPKRRKMR